MATEANSDRCRPRRGSERLWLQRGSGIPRCPVALLEIRWFRIFLASACFSSSSICMTGQIKRQRSLHSQDTSKHCADHPPSPLQAPRGNYMGRPQPVPACLASWAEIRSPVRTISMARDFPTARVSLWVPPAPAGLGGCWSQLALWLVQAEMPQMRWRQAER